MELKELLNYNLRLNILKSILNPVRKTNKLSINSVSFSVKGNKCPTQRELKELVTSKVAHKWFPIGIGLGMSGEQLEEIRENSNDIPDRCLGNLFYEWEQNPHKDKPFTWGTLLQVLRSVKVGEESLAKKLEEHFSM